ncbi:MAG TPA: response regulator [Bacteroidota bacterium]|nr:response regulator [Bacteroidota bacterium]
MMLYPAVLFLLFAAAFAWLFYLLEGEEAGFEHEKVQHRLDILCAAFQTALQENEKFFVSATQRSSGSAGLRRQCEIYSSAHPEIVSIQSGNNETGIRWSIPQDSSAELLAQAVRGTPLFSFADSSTPILYTKPFRCNTHYFIEARYPVPQRDAAAETCYVFYSAEKLLGDVLRRHPMENAEIAVFSGWGEQIASTGYSNAESQIRLQQGVAGYGRLLTVDIAEPAYTFWTAGTLAAAGGCAVLTVAVFVITYFLLRDLDSLHRVQHSLRSSEERFRAIFENSVDAMRLVDRYGRTVMVNTAYSDLVRTSKDDLLREYAAGDDNLEERYAANSAYRDQFDAGTLKLPAFQTVKRKGGEEIPAEVRHSFINIGRGKKLLLSIFRDVSEKKRYELEAQQVQKMDALGEFAVGIGNNLKNIFGIVMNSAEMMYKETFGNAQMEQYIGMILRESRRASELADDLLVFARSKSAEQRPVPVERLIHQAEKILQHSLAPAVTVGVSTDDSGAVVSGDIHQLHQAIVNLAMTAERRMTGGGAILLRTSIADPADVKKRIHFSEGKEYVIIAVADNGKELDEYSQRRIFEPYFNARATDQAAGLRLSVAYGIVQQHGGFIDVRSEAGKGTTISMYLPVAEHRQAGGGHEVPGVIQGGSECLLIVDDEESFRQLYEHGLVSFGYRVLTAQDGEEALSVYDKHRAEIDLVISDLSMPRMNGEDLFRKLFAQNPSIKGILATGAIDLKAKKEFLALGVRDIIMKPFLLDELMASVRKVLDNR